MLSSVLLRHLPLPCFLVIVNKLVHLLVLVCVCVCLLLGQGADRAWVQVQGKTRRRRRRLVEKQDQMNSLLRHCLDSHPLLAKKFFSSSFHSVFSGCYDLHMSYYHVVLRLALDGREREREEDTMVRVLSCQGDLRHLAYAFFARACCNGSLLL